MTVKDVGELSFVELEELMDGMVKYAERERKAIEKGTVEYHSAEDLISKVQSGTMDF